MTADDGLYRGHRYAVTEPVAARVPANLLKGNSNVFAGNELAEEQLKRADVLTIAVDVDENRCFGANVICGDNARRNMGNVRVYPCIANQVIQRTACYYLYDFDAS
jgi:hypothetical protein